MKKLLSLVCFSVLLTGAIIAQTQYNATSYHQFNTDYGYIQVGAQNASWAHIYTDRPNVIFNKPVYSMNGFLSYSSNLNLEAASGYYVQVKPRSSSYGLILREYNSNDYGNIEVTSSGLGLGYNTSGYHMLINTSGNIGINTTGTTGGKLNIKQGWGDWIHFEHTSNTGYWAFHNGQDQETFHIYYKKPDGTIVYPLRLKADGSIQTSEILVAQVNATEIKSKELRLDVDNVADYVFADDYKLRSLAEVEQFVKENKYLPGMPKGTDLENEGMNVAEMSNLLLEKIEELTLYMIELKKENEELKSEITLLKK